MRKERMLVRSRAGRLALALAACLSFAPGVVASSISDLLKDCASCHGEKGISITDNTPSLAGQPKIFIETQLILFRETLRPSEQMGPLTEKLTDAQITALADHYASLPARDQGAPGDPDLFRRGMEISERLRCGTCHLPDFNGRAQIPRLAGQREDYLRHAMIAYRDNKRGGADTTMTDILRLLSDADISALAHFVSRGGQDKRR